MRMCIEKLFIVAKKYNQTWKKCYGRTMRGRFIKSDLRAIMQPLQWYWHKLQSNTEKQLCLIGKRHKIKCISLGLPWCKIKCVWGKKWQKKKNRKWQILLGWLGAKEFLFRKVIWMLTYYFKMNRKQFRKESTFQRQLAKQANPCSSEGVGSKSSYLSFLLCSLWGKGWTPGRAGLLVPRPRK